MRPKIVLTDCVGSPTTSYTTHLSVHTVNQFVEPYNGLWVCTHFSAYGGSYFAKNKATVRWIRNCTYLLTYLCRFKRLRNCVFAPVKISETFFNLFNSFCNLLKRHLEKIFKILYILHNLEFFVCPLSTKFHQNTSNDVTSMFHTCHTILVLRPTPSCAIHASQKKADDD